MTKILDSFLFTHEFDLLELRLKLLWPVVDKFLLMEGDHNFANKPKKMRFNEQAERFTWASDKLVTYHHVGSYIEGDKELFVENQHRQKLFETATQAAKMNWFEGTDILLTSDVDEIPSREVLEKVKADAFESPTLLKQDFYYYNIKCHRGKRWNGTIISTIGHDLGDIGELRTKRPELPFIEDNCGWHFGHFYDSEGIREKLEHSSHQHYNFPEYYDPEHLKKCVEENKSFIGKKDGDLQPEPLPDYLLAELKNFPLMTGEEWR